MSKVSIVYWSGTGNTQKMAEAVAEGVKEAGAEADLKFVSAATVDELAAEPAFALGCPSMGAEVLFTIPPMAAHGTGADPFSVFIHTRTRVVKNLTTLA